MLAVINGFITRINLPGAKYAFESAYKNITMDVDKIL
jgi:hypothetical protein